MAELHYDIQEVFEEAREFIQKVHGLELTLSDLIRLREDYVVPAIKLAEHSNFPNSWGDTVTPSHEALSKFLSDWYALPLYTVRKNIASDEEVMRHLKIVQEDSFRP